MYIDPSATSYIIQIVAGIVITCGVVVGIFWNKIKTLIQKKKVERLEKKLHSQYDQEKNV